MTEKDAVEQVVADSITLKVDIEELRKWAKKQYAKAVKRRDEIIDDENLIYNFCKFEGEIHAYGRLIQKLDEIERGK